MASLSEGESVGESEGFVVGLPEGLSVGAPVGLTVGFPVGASVGDIVGLGLGTATGGSVTACDGATLATGGSVTACDGATLATGGSVTAFDGATLATGGSVTAFDGATLSKLLSSSIISLKNSLSASSMANSLESSVLFSDDTGMGTLSLGFPDTALTLGLLSILSAVHPFGLSNTVVATMVATMVSHDGCRFMVVCGLPFATLDILSDLIDQTKEETSGFFTESSSVVDASLSRRRKRFKLLVGYWLFCCLLQ